MKMMNFKRIFLAAFFLAATVLPLCAHPHMRLYSRFEFVWEGAELSGVWLEWTFDQFFSADIILSHDRDGNVSFNEQEGKAVYEYAFQYVGEYHYFTFIREGDKRTNPKAVKDFSASIRDGLLVYRFFIDLSACDSGDVSVAVYDYTFFCDIPYQETDAVLLRHDPELVAASCEIAENKKYPVYYNPYGAVDDTTIYYTWKKGLLTFYPREVRIRYGAP